MKYELTYVDPSGRKQGTFVGLDKNTMLLNLFGDLEDFKGSSVIIKEDNRYQSYTSASAPYVGA